MSKSNILELLRQAHEKGKDYIRVTDVYDCGVNCPPGGNCCSCPVNTHGAYAKFRLCNCVSCKGKKYKVV